MRSRKSDIYLVYIKLRKCVLILLVAHMSTTTTTTLIFRTCTEEWINPENKKLKRTLLFWG